MPHPNPCQPEDPSRDYTKCSRVKYRTHEVVVTHASRLVVVFVHDSCSEHSGLCVGYQDRVYIRYSFHT